jgi:hypothetical protein
MIRRLSFPCNSAKVAASACGESVFLLYNLFMNKRAKKRLKEAIGKDNQERAKVPKEQGPASAKELQKRPGFMPKPAKKRG